MLLNREQIGLISQAERRLVNCRYEILAAIRELDAAGVGVSVLNTEGLELSITELRRKYTKGLDDSLAALHARLRADIDTRLAANIKIAAQDRAGAL